jgi:hypothetical protein
MSLVKAISRGIRKPIVIIRDRSGYAAGNQLLRLLADADRAVIIHEVISWDDVTEAKLRLLFEGAYRVGILYSNAMAQVTFLPTLSREFNRKTYSGFVHGSQSIPPGESGYDLRPESTNFEGFANLMRGRRLKDV